MPPSIYPQAKCRYCEKFFVAAQIAQHEEDCADNPKNKDRGGVMGPHPRASDETRCPYCQCFFPTSCQCFFPTSCQCFFPTRDIEAHKATCSDRPDGR